MAVSNVLTNLIPNLYDAVDIVSRELTGLIPAATFSGSSDRVALNQSIIIPTTGAITAADNVPSMNFPNPTGQTIGNESITINKSRKVDIPWSGEEELSVSGSTGVAPLRTAQIAQAMRTLSNEIEGDIAALYYRASRAYGAAGVTPFSSGVGDTAQARKILADNGAPLSDLQMVIDTTAGATMRTNTQLSKANESGDTSMLRRGVLLDVNGFMIRESAQIKTHTAGTAASATTNNAGYAVGATVITLASAGTGTIVAGDVITFAGDANKYVVAVGNSDVSAGGTITIAAPGLRKTMSAATKAITVVADSVRNMAFSKSAILVAARVPAAPAMGDAAIDRMIVTDPNSGLSFSVEVYPGQGMNTMRIGLAWGCAVIKPTHCAILLG
jgi:hypothetical protein